MIGSESDSCKVRLGVGRADCNSLARVWILVMAGVEFNLKGGDCEGRGDTDERGGGIRTGRGNVLY